MKASTLFTLAAAAWTSTGSPIQKRELGGILICKGPNATGKCLYGVYEMQKCYIVPEPWHRNVNTFAPDGEGFGCFPRAYDCGQICTSPTGCTFGSVDFHSDIKYNMSSIGWNTLFGSFDCFINKTASS